MEYRSVFPSRCEGLQRGVPKSTERDAEALSRARELLTRCLEAPRNELAESPSRTMIRVLSATPANRVRLAPIADGLATAVAVSLPWSTSATGILVVLWLITLVPVLDGAAVRREVLSAAGGLPVLLWVLGAIGMLWADVS